MRQHQTSLATVLTTLLLLRALVPLGFMPVVTGAGELQLVICSGSGVHAVEGAADEEVPPGSREPTEVAAICPLAGLAAPFMAATPAVLRWQPALALELPLINRSRPAATAATTPALGARAPPAAAGAGA